MRKKYGASAMSSRHFLDFLLWTKVAEGEDDGKTWKTTEWWWFVPVKKEPCGHALFCLLVDN